MSDTSSKETQLGNPTVVASHVSRIADIVQTYGAFSLGNLEVAEPMRLSASHKKPDFSWSIQEDMVSVIIDVGFAGFTVNDEGGLSGEPIVTVEARFAVNYSLDNEFDASAITEADWDAFALVNGMLNITPYWREYVQDSISRTQLAPYYIPPFNVSRFLQKANSSEDPELSADTPD
ncbi:MAG: hypothetical protein JJ974_09820 [Phycisphaerales bacterium]|nr:hypothetical protein [Phycisphaerales bacterium]